MTLTHDAFWALLALVAALIVLFGARIWARYARRARAERKTQQMQDDVKPPPGRR
jgi:hypothetical protein